MRTIFIFYFILFFVVLLNLRSELCRLAMESRYLNIFCAFCHRKGHVIKRILHSWTFNKKFVRQVLVLSVFCLPRGSQNTEITQTRFINFILNDHSCKILSME